MTKKVLKLTKLMTQVPKLMLIYEKSNKISVTFPVYEGGKPIA